MVIPNIHPSILKRVMLFTCILCIFYVTNAQEKEYNTATIKINKYVEGTLITPYSNTEVPLVIMIMDAGAINRDGNDRMSQNNAFKKLAIVLAKQGIASFLPRKISVPLGWEIGVLDEVGGVPLSQVRSSGEFNWRQPGRVGHAEVEQRIPVLLLLVGGEFF